MERFTPDTLTDKIENLLNDEAETHDCHVDGGIDTHRMAEDVVTFLTQGTGKAHAPAGVNTFRKVVGNDKFGLPGEPPKIALEAVTVSDLITQLTEVLDKNGDVPVVLVGRNEWTGSFNAQMAIRGNRDHGVFQVYTDRPKWTHDPAYDAANRWDHEGAFLVVQVEI